MSKKTNISFCKKLDQKLLSVTAMLAAGSSGWQDSHGGKLAGDFDDRLRETVLDLQNIALWATMHLPHHIGLTKRA